MAMQHVLKHSPLQVTFVKVDGHADDQPDFNHQLASQPVKRNIDMDGQTKGFLHNPPTHLIPTNNALHFPGQIVSFHIDNITMTGNLRERVQYRQHVDALKTRICKSLGKSKAYLSIIEWEGLGAAFTKLSQADQISRTKIVHQYTNQRNPSQPQQRYPSTLLAMR